jgi:hypothetical protein
LQQIPLASPEVVPLHRLDQVNDARDRGARRSDTPGAQEPVRRVQRTVRLVLLLLHVHPRHVVLHARSYKITRRENWCVPLRKQRVDNEGVSKSEDIEINPKADFHPGTNEA